MARGTVARRGPFVAPTAHVPNANLVLTQAGLSFSANKLVTWAGDRGPSFTPTTGAEPRDGAPLLNGRAGALWIQSGCRAIADAAIADTEHAKHTFQVVMWPENGIGEGEREYLAYFQNASSEAIDHLVFAHQTNRLGFDKIGVFAGAGDNYLDAAPTHRPQVLAYTVDSGVKRAYRNRSLLASSTGPAVVQGYGDMNLGAAYGSPLGQFFHGAIYDVRAWCGIALTQTQIDIEQEDRMSDFGITGTEYYPSDSPSSISLWTDSRGKRGAISGAFDGTALYAWNDQSGNGTNWQGADGLYPTEGDRMNGRPTVRIGATKQMGVAPLSALVGSGASKTYDIKIPINLRSITLTDGTAFHLRDVILSDNSGYVSLVAYTSGGLPRVGLYHYTSLGATTLSDSIVVGDDSLVHAWYDGSTVGFQVNDQPLQSAVGVGNPNDLTYQVQIGKGFTSSGSADADIGEILFRNAYNSTIANNDRAYFGRVFNVAY